MLGLTGCSRRPPSHSKPVVMCGAEDAFLSRSLEQAVWCQGIRMSFSLFRQNRRPLTYIEKGNHCIILYPFSPFSLVEYDMVRSIVELNGSKFRLTSPRLSSTSAVFREWKVAKVRFFPSFDRLLLLEYGAKSKAWLQ